MKGIYRLAMAGAGGIGLVTLLSAASSPPILAGTSGGLWEVSQTGVPPVRLCVADPATLAQFEHRNASCTRDVVKKSESGVTINYSCSGRGFGHSQVTVVTPRSLRIETQGIAGDAPFKYVLQARRVGNCAGH